MKHCLSLTLSILFMVAGLASAQSQNKNEKPFRDLIKQLTDAQTAFDAKALDRIFTPDYIEISPAGEFDMRDKVLGFYPPEAKAAAGVTASVEANDVSVRNYGKFAVVIVRLDFTMTANGKTLPPRSMRATYVMRKTGTAWKIASAQYTGIKPTQKPNPTSRPAVSTGQGTAGPLEVRLPVSVTLRNKIVPGFAKEDFLVFEDGVMQEVTSFSDDKTNLPIFVGVLMDTSPATTDKLNFSKEAAMNFIHTVIRPRKDKAAFMTFDDTAVILRQDFTDKLGLLQSAVDKVKSPTAQTALYDAIWNFTDAKLRNASGRRVIVVISNSDDTISRADLNDAIDIAQRTETTIYAVSTKYGFIGSVSRNQAKFEIEEVDKSLIRLCQETGGEVFFAGDMLSLEKAFQEISERFRTQYVLTYRPANQKFDGTIRKIDVRFADEEKGKDLKIRTKSQYRAVRDPIN